MAQILEFIRREGEASTEAIASHIGLSVPRTGHYLRILVGGDKVKTMGANKNRTYILPEDRR